jgi:hypothetical protein
MNKKHLIIHVLFPLLLGGGIYWAARPAALAFKNSAHLSPLVGSKYLPHWVVFNLPDGLWSYSFLSFTLILWKNERSLNAYLWLSIAFLVGILLEICQYFHLISGTFDWLDILVYLIFNLFAIIQFKSQQHEK